MLLLVYLSILGRISEASGSPCLMAQSVFCSSFLFKHRLLLSSGFPFVMESCYIFTLFFDICLHLSAFVDLVVSGNSSIREHVFFASLSAPSVKHFQHVFVRYRTKWFLLDFFDLWCQLRVDSDECFADKRLRTLLKKWAVRLGLNRMS